MSEPNPSMQSDEEYESSQQGDDDDGEVSQDQTNDEGERVVLILFLQTNCSIYVDIEYLLLCNTNFHTFHNRYIIRE